MDEHDATLRRRGELPRRSPDDELAGIDDGFIGAEEGGAEPPLAGRLPAAVAPPDIFDEGPATASGSPVPDAPPLESLESLESPESSEWPARPSAERPPHPPGGEIWISASEDEGEGEIGLEGLGDDEGVLPG